MTMGNDMSLEVGNNLVKKPCKYGIDNCPQELFLTEMNKEIRILLKNCMQEKHNFYLRTESSFNYVMLNKSYTPIP
jgi:hypothetical protein